MNPPSQHRSAPSYLVRSLLVHVDRKVGILEAVHTPHPPRGAPPPQLPDARNSLEGETGDQSGKQMA
eukprot:357305-Chlamydomonas_euryale.AAC.1